MPMIYRSDRDRRMAGDTLLARRARFEDLHPLVLEIFALFSKRHHALQAKLELLRQETIEDQQARALRQKQLREGARLYQWAYTQLEGLLTSWEEEDEAGLIKEARARLFPLGSPSRVTGSAPKLYDALRHLETTTAMEREAIFPKRFLSSLKKRAAGLEEAIALVVKETTETHEVQREIERMRDEWDDAFTALKEITSGLLRLKGEHDRFKGIFHVPKSPPQRSNTTSDENQS